MFPIATQVLTVASEVPYDILIYGWLQIHDLCQSSFVQRSRQYERSFLAWETVRKVRNPFFVEGTGFEGYYIGQVQSPEEAAERLLQMGHYMLRSNYRLYRFDSAFRSRLMKTLLGEISDPKAIEVWSAQFGAALGRLRCNLLTNAEARYFQAETYLRTSSLPTIHYQQNHYTIKQEYVVPTAVSPTSARSIMGLDTLKPSDYDAGVVVWSIGKFGHPLVREYIGERGISVGVRAS